VCADIDANGWLNGVDAVPITEMDDEDGDTSRRTARLSDVKLFAL
jgi:endogenous inhibitor of DNA gyrase (YacG/DUF329 family)